MRGLHAFSTALVFVVLVTIASSGSEPPKKEVPRMKSTNRVVPVVEEESVVFDWDFTANGASPLWCYGNTCIVRLGNDVFASGIETDTSIKVKRGAPNFSLCNQRWLLFKHAQDGWRLQQKDTSLAREPAPLGCFQDGRVFLSHSPSTRGDRPEILEFDAKMPGGKYNTLLPYGDARRKYGSSTYRTFTVDGNNGEMMVFYNVGLTHSDWAFRNRDGKWSARGKLRWPKRKDTSITPYGPLARVNYPTVMLKNRAVHFAGAAAYNRWARVSAKNRNLAGRRYGNRWRRLFYTWTPDITKKGFSRWIEVGSTHDTGGWLFPGDLWVDDESVAHIAWFEAPVNEELREQHFPDLKYVYSLKYARVKDGKVLLRRTLAEGGEGKSPEIPGYCVSGAYVRYPSKKEKDGYLQQRVAGRGQPRFHVLPNGRLFALYFVGGTDADGQELAENRLIEILPDGSTGAPVRIPLEHPLIEYFVATPRGGSRPSAFIDVLGYRKSTLMKKICYARIRLTEGR